MSSASVPRLAPRLKEELEKADDWSIRRSKRHFQIRIGGHLAGVIPFSAGEAGCRAYKNIIAQVRRLRRDLATE